MADDEISKETLPHLIRRALAKSRADVLVERAGGEWTPTSSQRLLERVEHLACAIRDAGLQSGDRVALIAHDCVDWIACDFATFFAGCVIVPIFPTQAIDQTTFILEHSQAKLLFVDTHAAFDRLKSIGSLPRTVIFEGDGETSLSAFEARGALLRAQHPDWPAVFEAPLQPDDLAVLIYTSGTTGSPKGVMLTHDNLGFDARSSLEWAISDIEPDSVVLSVLPFSHIFEHTMIYIYLLADVKYHICHDPSELLHDLQTSHPVSMTVVPRILDRVIAGVTAQALNAGGVQAALVPWALAVGREYMSAKTFGHGPGPWLALQYAIAHGVVLVKLRERLGLDRLRYFTSGSAALHNDTAMTYLGMGVTILQGYGLTESSPVITTNRLHDNRFGSVGPPIPGVELRIAQDGEVLARGRNIMRGYYLDAAGTTGTIQDGWLHTGDIGELDADGYLRITDRKKEVFKTATGKYVSPARVESSLKRSIYIAQALVIGDGRPHPAALICPNWDLLRLELTLPAQDGTETLVTRADVVDFMTAQAQQYTADLATYEQIRRVILLAHEFTVESGELSPAMKVKRRVVEARYASEIERASQLDLHAHARS